LAHSGTLPGPMHPYPQPLGDECPRPEAVYYRALPDGYEICVYRMMFNWRVCYGPQEIPVIDDAYCYPTPEAAIRAASEWNGDGEPPVGWIKHPMTGRYRHDGDPEREETNGRRKATR